MRCDQGERPAVVSEHEILISKKILLSEDQ